MIKLHFISLGCPKNLVDSEVMLGTLVNAGYVLTEDPARAEVIVINTCAFIEDAKKEAIDTILSAGQYKKSGKCRLLIVAGCLPQRYEHDLAALLPEVDIFIGAGEFPKIVSLVREWQNKQSIHVEKPLYLYDHESPRLHITPGHVRYLKIAEGCFHPCSFCIIPKIRGPFRSRAADSIVEEAKQMIDAGVSEINLIAQDSTAYGRDIGSSLAQLLRTLALIKKEKWLRILYAYPHDFPDELIQVIKSYPDICKYIDLPIQHVNDRILKSMKRKGGGKEVRQLIEKLRSEIPNISIRTSLIVGYPGETKAEYDELLDFVCEMHFEHLGVFIFSPEEGTAAYRLKNRVPPPVAAARQKEIMNVQREISLGNNHRFLNQKIKVLVEGGSSESEYLLQARHGGQAPEVDGMVYINEGNAKAGEFKMVEITDVHEYDLIGRIVG